MDTYEKKYKDALDWMRKVYPTLNGSAKEDAEHYFPEVKESEDERIRKALIRCCDDWEKGQFGCMAQEDVPAIRAYLEKQKDSLYRDKIDQHNKEILDGTYKMLEHLYECTKSLRQKEQKPAEKQDYSGLNDLECAILRGFLAAGVENVSRAIIEETAQDCLAQIKPAKWSEEYENKIESIKGLITTGKFADTNTIRTIWKLLDSLRPQPHWKPSVDQIGALNSIILNGSFTYVGQVQDLISLKDELKKL